MIEYIYRYKNIVTFMFFLSIILKCCRIGRRAAERPFFGETDDSDRGDMIVQKSSIEVEWI